jgi:hypothetical protein
MVRDLMHLVISTVYHKSNWRPKQPGPERRKYFPGLSSGIGNKELIVTAKAYNGYHVTIPVNEFYDWDVLLATRENGEPIPLDARGPIRFVYDFAEVGAGKDSYWIWMLQELSVSPE